MFYVKRINLEPVRLLGVKCNQSDTGLVHDERRSACAHLFRRSALWAEAVWRIPTALLIGVQLPYSQAVTTKWKLGYIEIPEYCNLRNDTQNRY